jgi:hypothetical protein
LILIFHWQLEQENYQLQHTINQHKAEVDKLRSYSDVLERQRDVAQDETRYFAFFNLNLVVDFLLNRVALIRVDTLEQQRTKLSLEIMRANEALTDLQRMYTRTTETLNSMSVEHAYLKSQGITGIFLSFG